MKIDVTADGGGRRRDRDARLHAGAPRPRLRQLAGLAEHLPEHHDRQRLLQPLPDRLGRPGGDGAEDRDSPRRAGVRRLDSSSSPGTVTGKSQVDGEGIVEVELRATNDQGDHVSGTAVIGLPLARAGS